MWSFRNASVLEFTIPVGVVAEEARPEPPPETSAAVAELPARVPIDFPVAAVIVIADTDGYTDRQRKGEPYMWTWINGSTWFYVKGYWPLGRRIRFCRVSAVS